MGRYAASPADGGVYVLDTESGEVVFVGHDGSSRVLRAAVRGDGHASTQAAHPVDDVVLATFPAPVAWAWQDYLVETEARQKTRALVDSFAILLKQWAFVTSAAVFASPGLRDADLHRLLARDLQRPLISSWHRLIETSLPLLERHGDAPVRGWVETFGRVYASVQTQCRDRVTMPRPYLDEKGELRSNNAKVGWVDALLVLRNEMAHRALASQEVAQEELSTFEPIMRDLLGAAAELTPWQLVEVQQDTARNSRAPLAAYPWTGRHGRGAPFDVQRPRHLPPIPSDGCLLGIATRGGAFLPLPVFYGRERKDDAVRPAHLLSFDGSSSRGIRYVAGDGSRRDDQRPLATWNQLVAAISPPPDSLSISALTWETFTQRCANTTRLTLGGFEEGRVYHAALDAPRGAIEGAFSELLDERRALLLAGPPGVGKSFALASFARRRLEAGDAVLLLRSSELVGITPGAQVCNALGFPLGTTVEDVVARLAVLSHRGRRWLLLVDGLEGASPGAAEWLAATGAWVRTAAEVDVFRMAISTRTSTLDAQSPIASPDSVSLYVRRPRHHQAEPETAVFVGAFDLEAAEEAYERHRRHAIASGLEAPLTRFAELGATTSTREVLRDPVSMRLLIRAYAGRALPADLPWEEAIALFLERAVREPAHDDGGPRFRYLHAFAEWCARASVEELPREQLADHPRLGPAVFDTSAESPYAQLLELGVLVEEWRDARCMVGISPNRLFEHLLAGHLLCQTVDRLLGDVRRLDGMRSAPGAWTVALLRTLREGNAEVVVEALDACDHGRWRAARAPLVLAMTHLLATLAAHHEEELERFLDALVREPSRTDVELLMAAFESARALGRTHAMELIVSALATEAAALGDQDLRLEVKTRELEVALERSDGARTATLARALRVLVDAGASPEQAARAAVAEGRADLNASRYAEAGSHFERAQELAQALGRLGAASDASRWRSATAGHLGRHTEALERAEATLRLARESGDKAREGAALHRLAAVQHTLNQRDAARLSYERALVLHRQTGEVMHAAATSVNLAVLLLDNDDVAGAHGAFTDSLALFEATGNARGVSVALVNLAHIARLRGDTHTAIALATRAYEINVARMSPAEVARDLWLLAELALDRGDTTAAERHRQQLAEVELPEPSRRAVASMHDAALSLRLRILEGSGADASTDEFREHWNAAAACNVHLGLEERPVPLLRALRELRDRPPGVDGVLARLLAGDPLTRW